MESGLYGDGKLILALMAICSQTWQVEKRLDRDTEVAAHPVTASIVSYPVDPPCYGKPRQTQFKSNKIPAFAVTGVMANVLRSERIDQVESFSFVGRLKYKRRRWQLCAMNWLTTRAPAVKEICLPR